ncbi:hypothetical protein CY35_03G010200, partial [Sphagnum magellanicum]
FRTEVEWRTECSPEQCCILPQKGTEQKEEGVYKCVGCGTPLQNSTTEFDSGCGWPAFFGGLPGAITGEAGILQWALQKMYCLLYRHECLLCILKKEMPWSTDWTGFYILMASMFEIICTACGGHLGHVLGSEGFKTPTDAWHCVNSISLNFTPAKKKILHC